MLKGVRDVQRKLDKLSRELSRRAEMELRSEGEAILERSRNYHVPEDEGTLRDDSGVDVSAADGSVTAVIWYGKGEARDYAIPVHENPSQHDPPTWRGRRIEFQPQGRGPKYLETPLIEAEIGLFERIGRKLFD